MPINVWDYLREYDELRDEILAAVDRVFRSGRLVLGQEGVKFEREMAAYLGVRDGVGVNSGTDAIYIALAALGVKGGDDAAHRGRHPGPSLQSVRRSRSANGGGPPARTEGDGGLFAVAGRALQE